MAIDIKDYGFAKEHDPRSVRMYKFIDAADFANGDAFCFKSGGDGDNGEMLMDLLDAYWKQYDEEMAKCDT
jgi:hypothetical protein